MPVNEENRIAYQKRYRESHREEARRRASAYRKAHLEECRVREAEYAKTHKEEARVRWIEWRKKYAEKCRQYSKKWREKNKDRLRIKEKEYRVRHREKHKILAYKHRGNLPLAPKPDLCEVCKIRPATNSDHCHKSGLWRGWLCQPCNAAAGMLKENPSIIRALANYVEHHAEIAAILA